MGKWGMRLCSCAGAVVCTAAIPAAASGAVLTRDGTVLKLTGAGSEEDDFSIRREDNNDIVIFNLGSGSFTADAGSGCSTPQFGVSTCTGAGATVTRIVADTGEGDDSIAFSELGFTGEANLGPGTDVGTIVDQSARPFRVALNGGAGGDSLIGGSLNDTLAGDAGDDFLRAGGGPDDIHGGADVDKANFGEASRLGGVTVSLDNQANDGNQADSENDNVHSDVEFVEGTASADELVGNGGNNTLSGFGGADELDGRGGFDILLGGEDGDTLNTRDGNAELADCGGGIDTALLDPRDLHSSCETAEVDDDAPQTEITKKPKRRTGNPQATLKFKSSEPLSDFECKLDGGQFKSCNSPFKKNVSPGKHTFEVRAVDPSGNKDPSPAKARWKVT